MTENDDIEKREISHKSQLEEKDVRTRASLMPTIIYALRLAATIFTMV